MSERIPPYSEESEQALIGAVLLDHTAFFRVNSLVQSHHFHLGSHRLIYKAIENITGESKRVDSLTVCEWLSSRGFLEKVGGRSYISSLQNKTPSVDNVKEYAETVRSKSSERALLKLSADIETLIYSDLPTDEKMRQAEKLFELVTASKSAGSLREMHEIIAECVESLDERHKSGKSMLGVPTGFDDLDEKTSGLQPGDLIIVAGRPSMGKTSFGLNIAENIAIHQGATCLIFSLEMNGASLGFRSLARVGKIPMNNFRSAQFGDDDWARMTHAVSKLRDAKILIDDNSGMNLLNMRSVARSVQVTHGPIGLIVVDYLGLVDAKGDSDNAKISAISAGLKKIAKEFGAPVIALAQLNRDLEKRSDKRPMMSDLRGSGSIEQDADLILFLYRDEVYNPDSSGRGSAEVIVAKQRNGAIGVTKLAYTAETMRFDNLYSHHDKDKRSAGA